MNTELRYGIARFPCENICREICDNLISLLILFIKYLIIHCFLFSGLCCSFGSVSSLEIISLTNISSTSLKVEWNETFYDGSTSIPKYRVFYLLANCSTRLGDESIFQNVTLNTDILRDNNTQLSHTISNLSRWSFYQVKVVALFDNGTVFGNISETKCERTSEDGRFICYPVRKYLALQGLNQAIIGPYCSLLAIIHHCKNVAIFSKGLPKRSFGASHDFGPYRALH